MRTRDFETVFDRRERSGFQAGLTRFLAFLDARSANEWIAFAAGLIIGILL
jgi:hypothetical protein